MIHLKKSKKNRFLFLISLFLLGGLLNACGGVASLIESARFELDRCNPTKAATLSHCTAALQKATQIQVTDPNNPEAALIASSANLGLAHFDLLTFAANLAELADSNIDDFERFRTFISDYEADLGIDTDFTDPTIQITEFQDAIAAFDTVSFTGLATDANGILEDKLFRRVAFQRGIMQALETFILPVKISAGGVTNVDNITNSIFTSIQDSMLNADNSLILGGTTAEESSDILRPLRENYCRCSLQTGGLTITCLKDLMRCELYDGTNIEQDYDGNLVVDATTDCAALLNPSGIDSCGADDTQ